MSRTFNTTGPCRADKHYMVPPEQRLPDLLPLVEEELYFVVHAARQTGKTTAMLAFAERLRALGYACVYATLETSQQRTGLEEAELSWLDRLKHSARIQLPPEQRPEPLVEAEVGGRLGAFLTAWSEKLHPTPLVVLLDEVDVLEGPPLVNLLRQLRAGFLERPEHFPASVALVGMRDLRDYLAYAKDGKPINPGSPFNIKSASLTMRNFSEDELAELYEQHHADTGQAFAQEAKARAFWWTGGQPFLANALARTCVMDLVTDRGQSITAADVDVAKERLILARTTHLHSLAERLREPRVAHIVQPVVLGDTPFAIPYSHDDFQYVLDLGLLVQGPAGAEAANPLYQEVMARQLSYNIQSALPPPWWRWEKAGGGLDFVALIDAFLQWWRENEQALHAHGTKGYPEAFAHLSFMAFLQRVVNGGGTVLREYAAGRRAVDIVVSYKAERFVVELKRVHPGGRSLDKIKSEGMAQLADYLQTLGEPEGWLLIFDQRPEQSWEQRLWREEHTVDGRRLHLVGA